ncbi:hypothetical protein F2Q69_00019295 [Brassica cretica]|uniref:Glycosyltransferase N-terminal domain-containing protein n=1 Tax=Brassica cretica TaxID=69181 RepID=A0A8S9Q4K1_BRACR|nr:hypothetical protein F2Q69_00019295 [Brassica cretica]
MNRLLLRRGGKLHAYLMKFGIARLTRVAANLVALCVEFWRGRECEDCSSGYVSGNALIARIAAELRTRELIREWKMIHWMVLKCSFESDAFMVSSLVDMYSKFGEVENARIAAVDIPEELRMSLDLYIRFRPDQGERMEEEKRVKRRIVLVPVPAQGHVTPIMQLGKALHSKDFSITVVQTQYNRVTSSKDFSDFHFLTIPGSLTESDLKNLGPLQFMMKLNQICEATFKQCLGQLLKEQGDHDEVVCVVYDEYMHFSKAAAMEFQLPSVVFSTTNVEMQDKLFPGLHPLRYKDLPTSAFGPIESMLRVYSKTVNTGTASAVIINSASCLESSSLARLQQELQVPVYPIGPLHIAASAPSSLLEEDRSCIEWLNMQKPRSVINAGFEGVGFAEKLRLKIGSEEEYEVGFVEKLLGNMGFEEEEGFVEKLRLKTSDFEEK